MPWEPAHVLRARSAPCSPRKDPRHACSVSPGMCSRPRVAQSACHAGPGSSLQAEGWLCVKCVNRGRTRRRATGRPARRVVLDMLKRAAGGQPAIRARPGTSSLASGRHRVLAVDLGPFRRRWNPRAVRCADPAERMRRRAEYPCFRVWTAGSEHLRRCGEAPPVWNAAREPTSVFSGGPRAFHAGQEAMQAALEARSASCAPQALWLRAWVACPGRVCRAQLGRTALWRARATRIRACDACPAIFRRGWGRRGTTPAIRARWGALLDRMLRPASAARKERSAPPVPAPLFCAKTQGWFATGRAWKHMLDCCPSWWKGIVLGRSSALVERVVQRGWRTRACSSRNQTRLTLWCSGAGHSRCSWAAAW